MTSIKPPLSVAGHRVIYGIHAVTELLRNRSTYVSALLICQDPQSFESQPLREILLKAQSAGQSPLLRPKSELDRLSMAGVHQGIVALCGEYKYTELSDMISAETARLTPSLFLVLDGITDPQNLGALIRSAHVMGASGLILPHDRSASVNGTVVKTSSGATEWISIARVPNLVRAMGLLKEAGVWLYATTLQSKTTKTPWEVDFTQNTGLVLGSEGHGLRPLVQKTCDVHLHIPMQGQMQGGSLNVSACGAVLLYEVLRQRS